MTLHDVQAILAVAGGISAMLAGFWRYGIKPTRSYLEARRQRNAAVELIITEMAPLVRKIAQQVLPNGGSSIADKVSEIRSQILVTHRQRDLAMSAAGMAAARTDELGFITDVSRSLQKQTGRTIEELVGKGWFSCIDELDQERVRRGFMAAVEDRRDYEFIFAWTTPNNRPVPVRIIAWPQHDEAKKFMGHLLHFTEVEDAVWPIDKVMTDRECDEAEEEE